MNLGRRCSATPVEDTMPLTVVVFGATGDLAQKKLFPALYQLIYGCPDAPLLPEATHIVGFGRTHIELAAFLGKQCVHVQGSHRDSFLRQISYFQGSYDKEEDFARLHKSLCELERGHSGNRIFFLSIPPDVFGRVCENIHRQTRAEGGYTRLVIEKPFGRDSRSFAELNNLTSRLFHEDQLFRIDHYLAKEKVLNMVAFRFANQLYEPVWNRHHIAQVELVVKENIGTEGRGGYFDNFGIIRDIMQNHLLQVFVWLTMEPPECLDADHIAIEKCRVLEATRTLEMKDCFLGQFAKGSRTDEDGNVHSEQGYLDDSTVPPGSRCPTFAAVALNVENERWRGVPFLMRAGKGLNERVAEVRVMFKRQMYNEILPGQPNELVLRIQPNEGIYLKCQNKRPGWNQDSVAPVLLNMDYKSSFPGSYVAAAYERMLLNAARGDRSLFVGSTELVEAWRIFTPILDEIDTAKPEPVLYPFGSREPAGLDDFAQSHGVHINESQEEAIQIRCRSASETSTVASSPKSSPFLSSTSVPLTPPRKLSFEKTEAAQASSAEKCKMPESLHKDRLGKALQVVEPTTPPRQWRRLKSHDSF